MLTTLARPARAFAALPYARDLFSSPVADPLLDSQPAIRNPVERAFSVPLLPFPSVKFPRKTIRYECVGGPRDGDVVLIQRTKHNVELDGALYEVRLWAKMDEHGQRLLWKREALVWEGLLTSTVTDQPTIEPAPPQPVDWHPRDG